MLACMPQSVLRDYVLLSVFVRYTVSSTATLLVHVVWSLWFHLQSNMQTLLVSGVWSVAKSYPSFTPTISDNLSLYIHTDLHPIPIAGARAQQLPRGEVPADG